MTSRVPRACLSPVALSVPTMKLSLDPHARGFRAPQPRARARILGTTVALALFALPVASCTSDEIVAWEDTPDSGSVLPPSLDAGGPRPLCGNGLLDDGEGCDDGNTRSGDGCSATCVVEEEQNSACPGTAITLGAPSGSKRTAAVTGDTSTSSTSFDSPTCGGGNGKDLVYALTSDLAGRGRARLSASFNAYVALRGACADPASERTCKPLPVGGGASDIVFPIAKGETVYLIVDGIAGESGPFTLDVEVDGTACGDGLAQWPEQCDDGNTVAGDGCSPSCMLEVPLSDAGRCPGATYALQGSAAGPRTVSFAGDVSQLASTASTIGCGFATGKDQVYAITPSISGALTAVLHASYPRAGLHVRRECFTSQTQVDCHDEAVPLVPLTTTFPVVANNTYFIFADSASSNTPGGPYTLDVTLSPPTCGNGILETPEQCDDGNTTAGDGCAADCTLEALPGLDTCPGATVAFEGAPGGPLSFRSTSSTSPLTGGVRTGCGTTGTKDAVYSFVAPYNGWLEASVDARFNAALHFGRNCIAEGGVAPTTVQCTNALSGTGVERVRGAIEAGQTYFLVVKGGTVPNEGAYTLDVNVKPSVCGNGVIEGGETCDDGGTEPGDACDASCQIEPLSVPPTRTNCATAEALVLTEGDPGVFSTSVIGGNWNLPGGGYMAAPCGSTAGREAYFTITPPIDGVVVARTKGSYKIALGVRPACPPNTSTGFITCSDQTTVDGERVSFPAKAGSTYWIIVDSPSLQANGRFQLDVSLQGESCGDGIVSGAEQCDDGNTTAGDGCSATCTIEPLVGTGTCPGYAVALSGATSTAIRSRVVSISTATHTATYAGSCGGNGRDGVVAVTSDISGTLRAQLTSAWPSVLYARSTCADGTTEIGCVKADPARPDNTLRDLSRPVVAGTPIYLFIDGLSGASGPASLSLTVTP